MGCKIMAINFGNKISQDDVSRVRDIRNPPQFDPAFSGSDTEGGMGDSPGTDDGFGGLFDDLGDFGSDPSGGFGDLGGFGDSGGFGSPSGGFGDTGGFSNPSSSFGNQSSGFGNPSGGFSNPSGGFGNPNGFGNQSSFGGDFQNPFMQQNGMQQTQQQQKKPDALDKAIDISSEAAVGFGHIIMETVKSIKNRNYDDFGYLSRNMIIAGLSCSGVAVAIGLIGTLRHVSYISFSGMPLQVLGAGLLTFATGLAGLGFSAIKIAQSGGEVQTTIQDIPDIATTEPEDATSDYEDSIGDIMDDLFGDLDDITTEDLDETSSSDIVPDPIEDEPEPIFAAPVKVDFNTQLENISENQYLSRETLFNTFKPFFPCNTPTFADRKEVAVDSDIWNYIETLTLKALCNIVKCELDDINSKMEKCEETFFSYEYRMKRIRGLNKTDDIAREIEAYTRDGSADTSKTATVDIEGDFYKIILTKGESAIVTMGDIFRQKYVCDFILDSKNKLPIITGITELGEVVMNDAKIFDTMLIAGKPRSGKSWYVLSILLMLSLFNTPEDVQFIIVDPKESNLFNTFALLPHVAGLHNDKKILEIMDDIIINEGARRKKILSDNRCDDIWALRKKGIKLPILYLVIDEYITVRNNLGAMDKELDNKLQVIISQLPSQGIRLLFVPHRATGVVNKTNRTMLQFTGAVRADIEDVKDTLGIQKWTRALTKPGDIAIKTSAEQNARYVRGAAVTTDDDENAELIKNAAKAFYKMGVDMPDMSNMTIAVNRNEEKIRNELGDTGTRLQYNNWDN